MTKTAIVNYHVHKNERQAFELDAGGIAGNLISPELAPVQVALNDVRKKEHPVRFEHDAVEFVSAPSAVEDFSGEEWQPIYDEELRRLLTDRLGVRDVLIFDHTVRVDDPDAARKPARNVHSDYSEDGAKQRLIDLLGPDKSTEWSKGHYGFISLRWIPLRLRSLTSTTILGCHRSPTARLI